MRNKYFDLFFTFAKIGLFTFGGGYAMIPLIQKEAAENKHWVSEADILDIVAIAETTPGPIAIKHLMHGKNMLSFPDHRSGVLRIGSFRTDQGGPVCFSGNQVRCACSYSESTVVFASSL